MAGVFLIGGGRDDGARDVRCVLEPPSADDLAGAAADRVTPRHGGVAVSVQP